MDHLLLVGKIKHTPPPNKNSPPDGGGGGGRRKGHCPEGHHSDIPVGHLWTNVPWNRWVRGFFIQKGFSFHTFASSRDHFRAELEPQVQHCSFSKKLCWIVLSDVRGSETFCLRQKFCCFPMTRFSRTTTGAPISLSPGLLPGLFLAPSWGTEAKLHFKTNH